MTPHELGERAAFPTHPGETAGDGMTIRVWLAGMAMQGLMAAGALTDPEDGGVQDGNIDYLERIAATSEIVAAHLLDQLAKDRT